MDALPSGIISFLILAFSFVLLVMAILGFLMPYFVYKIHGNIQEIRWLLERAVGKSTPSPAPPRSGQTGESFIAGKATTPPSQPDK